jgi:FAD/FMN-containing dehydrogenase
MDAYGGAIRGPSESATAFPHRDALYSIQILGLVANATVEAASQAWMNGLRRALAPYRRGEYRNYADGAVGDDAGPSILEQYYGGNLARLQSLKKEYDPEGLFRHARTHAAVNKSTACSQL